MKIGLVTGEYPPMAGGVGAFSQELARALAADGHEVHIITSAQAWPPDIKKKFQRVREPFDLGFAQIHPYIKKWGLGELHNMVDIAIRQELELVNIQYQAAAYNMRSPAVNLLPWRLRGVAVTAVTFHDLRVPYLFPKAGRLRRTAVNFMARQADGVIATNPEDYEALRRLGVGDSRLAQIPIGSNIEVYDVTSQEITAVRAELSLAADDFLLGYFGFLNESKGADTLIQALVDLPENVHLVFIGGRTGSSDTANNAAFWQQLDDLITQLNLTQRVHWTGFVPAHHVSAWLQATDVLVMPYRDGASLRRGTLMAALAHGRPLITTTPTTPTPELAHGRNVWLVPSDDAAELAAAIQMLRDDADLRQRLGREAAKTAELFTWEKIAGDTAVFFQQLLKLQNKRIS
ncbi:MAG TPA: glycosyltransferase family 1 protein [Anaerolineae bacterium]|nr:glycosyltransferase family 1 protein [Anaerolineae bacterium]